MNSIAQLTARHYDVEAALECVGLAPENENACDLPRDHAGGSTTIGLRLELGSLSIADLTLHHMTFSHRCWQVNLRRPGENLRVE